MLLGHRHRCLGHRRTTVAVCLAGPASHAMLGASSSGGEPHDTPGAILAVLKRGQPMLANVTDEYHVIRLYPNKTTIRRLMAFAQVCYG
jgi:hypothetical protein